jgi:hypothetical protein
MPFIPAIVGAVVAGAVEVGTAVVGAVADVAATAATAAASAASAAVDAVGSIAATVGESVSSIASTVGDGLSGMSDALGTVGQSLGRVATQVGTKAKDLKETMKDLEKVGKDDKLGQVKDATKATHQLHSIVEDNKKITGDIKQDEKTLSHVLTSTKEDEAKLKATDTTLTNSLKDKTLSKDDKTQIQTELKDDSTTEKTDDGKVKKITDNLKTLGDKTTKIGDADKSLNDESNKLTKEYKLPKPHDPTQLSQPNQTDFKNKSKAPQLGTYNSASNNTLNPDNSKIYNAAGNAGLSLPSYNKHSEQSAPASAADVFEGTDHMYSDPLPLYSPLVSPPGYTKI